MKNDISIKAIFVAVLCIFSFYFSSCGLQSPAAPSWEVDLSIPLINKSFSILDEIVDSTENLTSDGSGNLFVEFNSEIDTFSAAGKLTIGSSERRFSQQLGKFDVSVDESRSTKIEFREVFSQADQLDGLQAPIPAFGFTVPTRSFQAIEGFDWVEISRGTIDVTVVNNLPVALGSPITITLKDAVDDSEIAVLVISDLIPANGGMITPQIDLAGKKITSTMALSIVGTTQGTNNIPVTINATDGFQVNISIRDLEVSAAAAKIEQQYISQSDRLPLPDSTMISSAVIREGEIDVQLGGNFPVDTEISFKIPAFVSATGDTLSRTLRILQGQQQEYKINLAGYTFKPSGSEFGEQTARFDWNLTTLQATNEIVELRAEDFLEAIFRISSLDFSRFSGKFESKRLDIPEQSLAIDIPDEIENISFQDAQLELSLKNSIYFPAQITVSVTGKNSNGETVAILVESELQAGNEDGSPVTTKLIFNKENSAIVDLLNILPDSVTVNGQIELGGNDWLGSLGENDQVSGLVRFAAPLAFKVPAQTYDADISTVEINQDVQDKIENNLLNAFLDINLVSHLPVAATIELYFSTIDTSQVYTAPGLTIGPLSVKSGEIDQQTGRVAAPRSSALEIVLNREQLRYFVAEEVFLGVKVNLPGTGEQTISLLATDYISINAAVKLKVLAGEGLIE